MKEKNALRGAATHNEAHRVNKSMIARRRLKNKVRRAAFYGSVLGALTAVIIGGMMIDSDPLKGFLLALPGLGWMYLFYFINQDDRLFGR